MHMQDVNPFPDEEKCAKDQEPYSKELALKDYEQKIAFTTSLHYYAAQGHLEKCLLLLKAGFDKDEFDLDGYTPLMHAVRNGQTEIVKLLSDTSPNLKPDDSYGVHLIELAVASGNISTVEFIINVAYFPNSLYLPTFALACTYGFKDIVDFLLQEINTDINAPLNDSGMTSLMLAVAGGHTAVVRALVSLGAKIDQRNCLGQTALDIAIDMKNEKIQALLGNLVPITPLYFLRFIFPDNKQESLSPKNSTQFIQGQPPKNLNEIDKCFWERDEPSKHIQMTKKYFKIPEIKLIPPEETDYNVHHQTLTPNICMSPSDSTKKSPWKQKYSHLFCFKPLRKRSKSVESQKQGEKIFNGNNTTSLDILEYILNTEKLMDCWPIFKEEKVNLKIFLTMNEDDLLSIGIKKGSTRQKLLKIISHYKRVLSFY